MTGLQALTKLQILAFCEKQERSWSEIKAEVKKSDPTLLGHINDLLDSKLLIKTDRKYKSTTNGIEIKNTLNRLHKINQDLKKISKKFKLSWCQIND